MKTKELTLRGKHGLHLRVAGEIVKLVKAHDCKMSLSCDGCKYADGCSILQLLTLGASKGSKVEVHVTGPDADVVIEKLSDIFDNGAGI